MSRGLTKFQEQDLMASVEQLENLKDKIIDNFGEYSNINKSFDKIIDTIKGLDMLGWKYSGPFDQLPAQQNIGGYPIVNQKLKNTE